MKLSAIDLNLLVALDTLLTESSVARAAMRLGRSQPAVSHSLRHLRHLFDDPLLVRVGHRMHLTPKAESLRAPLRDLIEGAASLISPSDFDARTTRRRFRMMLPDLVAAILLPPLVERISNEAPNVVLELVGWRGPELMTPEFARSVDIIVSWSEHSVVGFHRQKLYTDRDELAFRAGHPEAASLSSLEGFLGARHIAVIGSGEPADPIDQWLSSYDIQRPIAITVATYVQALLVAAQTNLIAFAPARTIASLAPRLGLDRCNPPIEPGDDEQYVYVPTRAAQDPATIWLRSIVMSLLTPVAA